MIGTNFGIYRPNNKNSNGGSGNNGAAVIDKANGIHLSDFMAQLEDYVPTIPDAVTLHYMNSGGFETNDMRIVRLISIVTQKFISDVANDALQNCKIRTNAQPLGNIPGSTKPKERKYTLTIDDLKPALADSGISIRKAEYFQ